MKYNTFLYGGGAAGALYGETSIPATSTNLLWVFIVDWDADGFYSGENEASYMVGLNLSRGRDHFVTPSGDGLERYQVGQATILLDNTDGRYNSFNPASPLYPHVTPGKPCRIAVQNGATGSNYELMRGRISDIQPYNDGNRQMVKVEVVDGQQFLRDRTIKIGYRQGSPYIASIHQAEWTTGQWVDLILERADWPDSEWPRTYDLIEDQRGNQLGISDTENFYRWLNFAWFWLRDAYEAIGELENAELGTFLHARDGSARFLSSHFSYDQRIEIDQAEVLTDISVPQPWEVLRNKIEARVHYIHAAGITPVVVWQVGGTGNDAIPVAAENSRTFEAEFRYFNYKIVPPSITWNWSFNSQADGLGTDLAAQTRVQISEVGDGGTIIFLNDSVTNGYITNLSVTADPIYSPYSTVTEDRDAASIATYETRAFRLESPWLQEFDWADTLVALLLANLKDPTQYPTIQIEARPTLQFPLDLYVDAVHFSSNKMNVNKLYRIGKIEHTWLNQNGQAVRTTLKLEPYFAIGAAVELDIDLSNPFASGAETDCSGSPAAGKMEWCLGAGWSWNGGAGQDGATGVLRSYQGESGISEASTDTEGYVIPVNGFLTFYYKWLDTTGMPPESLPEYVVITTGAGVIVNQPVPFEVVAGGSWTQMTIDLSAFAGQTISDLTLSKSVTSVNIYANFYVDNLKLGARI